MAKGRVLFGGGRLRQAQAEPVDQHEVARVAYGLYEQRGRENGHAVDDWLQAEAIVRTQQQLRG